jgi:bacteriorhodopsin
MPMYDMTKDQFDLLFNAFSFTFASMLGSTAFFWLSLPSVHQKYKTALKISGLVTFIAAYHYYRIFNSWVDAYSFGPATDGVVASPTLSGKGFNDAFRYMDWLLTVPLLLLEIVFCMNLSEAEMSSNAWSLGIAAALMIAFGYPGATMVEGDLTLRWFYWFVAMIPFVYIVYKLAIGLRTAIETEDGNVKSLLTNACWLTVISWCFYPVVYLFPMLGISGASSVVAINLGYCACDIISKCGLGFMIYNVTLAKSAKGGLIP